jgi:cytochrome c556
MMKRIILAGAIAVLGVTAVLAQSDPIAARKAMMKSNGQAAGQGAKFMKGEEPFDLAKAKAILATYEKSSAEFGKLFPDNAKTGGETAALPVIWENKADFNAKLVKFGADAKDAAGKIKDEASFKAVFPEVQKNCGGCHQTYRKKAS